MLFPRRFFFAQGVGQIVQFIHQVRAITPIAFIAPERVRTRYKNPKTGRPVSRKTFARWRRFLCIPVAAQGSNQHSDTSAWITTEDVDLLDAWYYLVISSHGPRMNKAEFVDRFWAWDETDPDRTPQQRITDYLNEHQLTINIDPCISTKPLVN